MENLTFTYLDSINETKEDLMEQHAEDTYQPFLINRYLSGNFDTIFYANEMNRRPFLDKKLQYEYFRTAIRERKRRCRWFKREKNDDIKVLQKYYGYSYSKVLEILPLLTKDDIENIKNESFEGGITK